MDNFCILFGIDDINLLQVSIGICWVGPDEVNIAHWRKGGWLRNINRRVIHTFHFVANCLDRYLCFVHKSLKPQKSDGGRGESNKKTSESTENRTTTLVKSDPFMLSRQIAGEINNEVSLRTIRRRLKCANLPGWIARRVPLLHDKFQNFSAQKNSITDKENCLNFLFFFQSYWNKNVKISTDQIENFSLSFSFEFSVSTNFAFLKLFNFQDLQIGGNSPRRMVSMSKF